MKREEQKHIIALRKKGEESRKESLMNRSKSRIEALESKIRIKEDIRMKSHEHEIRIKQFRQDAIDRKKSKCLELYNDLRSSRMHVEEMQKSHVQ